MRKCAIIIGVDNVPKLPRLKSAVAGAKKIMEWAIIQGFETYPFLDDDPASPVLFHKIINKIIEIVDAKDCGLLVVYFSGHGFSNTMHQEHWLLSQATINPTEAISVNACLPYCEGTGIPHIVFISDACRSFSDKKELTRVSGNAIIPGGDSLEPTKIDQFFSCSRGDSSYEIRELSESSESYSIFTKSLLNGLYGYNIELTRDELRNKQILEPWSLENYLLKHVPKEAFSVRHDLIQKPIAYVTSKKPKFISEFDLPDEPENIVTVPTEEIRRESLSFSNNDLNYGQYMNIDTYIEYELIESDINNEPPFSEKEYQDYISSISLLQKKRRIYAINKGFIIYTENLNDINESGYVETISPNLKMVNLYNYYPYDIFLLSLSNGNSVPLPVISGFIGVIWIKKGTVINISYRPSFLNPKYEKYIQYSDQIDRRSGLIIRAAHAGINSMFKHSNTFEEFSDYIRRGKTFDPTFGLFAAYGYAKAGLWSDVADVYRYMQMEPELNLFDIKMLTVLSQPELRKDKDRKDFHVGVPLLTQGWSFISDEEKLFPKYLKELASHLVSGLWTTLNPVGTAIMIEKQ